LENVLSKLSAFNHGTATVDARREGLLRLLVAKVLAWRLGRLDPAFVP